MGYTLIATVLCLLFCEVYSDFCDSKCKQNLWSGIDEYVDSLNDVISELKEEINTSRIDKENVTTSLNKLETILNETLLSMASKIEEDAKKNEDNLNEVNTKIQKITAEIEKTKQ